MIVSICPITDIKPHSIFDTACECGCSIEFVENGNMIITHQQHSDKILDRWGVFEEEMGMVYEN